MAAKKKKPAKRASRPTWRSIVVSSLGWDEAHATLADAARGLAPTLQGTRAPNLPHSAWELLDHIRRVQHDLLDFMTNAKYTAPHFPNDYWPPRREPPNAHAWDDCLADIEKTRAKLKRFLARTTVDLAKPIPWGDGQTYLRTFLVAADHEAYHVGQIVLVRQALNAWK
jgi:hypothetical protein